MKRTTLFLAISFSIISLWWTYRFFTNLPQIAEQPQWITMGDVLSLIVYWMLSITNWGMFVKNRKQRKDKKEE